jgi:hypothetical protein
VPIRVLGHGLAALVSQGGPEAVLGKQVDLAG